jgi:hypothetical protein
MLRELDIDLEENPPAAGTATAIIVIKGFSDRTAQRAHCARVFGQCGWCRSELPRNDLAANTLGQRQQLCVRR